MQNHIFCHGICHGIKDAKGKSESNTIFSKWWDLIVMNPICRILQKSPTKKKSKGSYTGWLKRIHFSRHSIMKPSHHSGQISIIPKPELRGFWGSSLIKPPFRVTSADVAIICPDHWDNPPNG